MKRSLHVVIVFAVAAFGGAFAPASAASDPSVVPAALSIMPGITSLSSVGDIDKGSYGWENKGLYAAYLSAAKSGIPAKTIAYQTWMTGNAVEAPVYLVRWSGGRVAWAWRCMPHDCGDNQLDVIYDPTTHKAFGLAKFERTLVPFGNPTTQQRALLIALYAARLANRENDLVFPIADASMEAARKNIRSSKGDFAAFFPL